VIILVGCQIRVRRNDPWCFSRGRSTILFKGLLALRVLVTSQFLSDTLLSH